MNERFQRWEQTPQTQQGIEMWQKQWISLCLFDLYFENLEIGSSNENEVNDSADVVRKKQQTIWYGNSSASELSQRTQFNIRREMY